MLRNTSRVNLRVARISEIGALSVSPPRSRSVAPHRIRGEEENVSVSTSTQNNAVGRMRLKLTCCHIASNDALGMTILQDKLDHFMA